MVTTLTILVKNQESPMGYLIDLLPYAPLTTSLDLQTANQFLATKLLLNISYTHLQLRSNDTLKSFSDLLEGHFYSSVTTASCVEQLIPCTRRRRMSPHPPLSSSITSESVPAVQPRITTVVSVIQVLQLFSMREITFGEQMFSFLCR